MTARSFCITTASTKRAEDLGSGRKGAPVANLASVLITPLWPLTQETQRVLEINSPREFKECYHVPATGGSLPDIVEGDVLVVGASEYPVYHVSEWTDIANGETGSLQIVVQAVKGT